MVTTTHGTSSSVNNLRQPTRRADTVARRTIRVRPRVLESTRSAATRFTSGAAALDVDHPAHPVPGRFLDEVVEQRRTGQGDGQDRGEQPGTAGPDQRQLELLRGPDPGGVHQLVHHVQAERDLPAVDQQPGRTAAAAACRSRWPASPPAARTAGRPHRRCRSTSGIGMAVEPVEDADDGRDQQHRRHAAPRSGCGRSGCSLRTAAQAMRARGELQDDARQPAPRRVELPAGQQEHHRRQRRRERQQQQAAGPGRPRHPEDHQRPARRTAGTPAIRR